MRVIKTNIFFLLKRLKMKKNNTVEGGYNNHGYNEFMVITNTICGIIWSLNGYFSTQTFTVIIKVITNVC